MNAKSKHAQRALEIFLVVIVLALMCLLHRTAGHKMVVMNLFYLPVVLAAFYLGRYRAGVLALFCVMVATVVSVADLSGFEGNASPIMIGLSVTVWSAILGLTAILVGTLSDERAAKISELHEAYVGVVEVLARYLQSANPKLKDRSIRVSGLSESVARQMRLSEKECDDIRVAALLQDMENIEVTARVLRKAVDDLGDESQQAQHTFHGTDLVHSLGSVLTGAFPLVLSRNTAEFSDLDKHETRHNDVPIGGRIIHTVRAYDTLANGVYCELGGGPLEAINELRRDIEAEHHPAVLHALECVVTGNGPAASLRKVAKEPASPVAMGI